MTKLEEQLLECLELLLYSHIAMREQIDKTLGIPENEGMEGRNRAITLETIARVLITDATNSTTGN